MFVKQHIFTFAALALLLLARANASAQEAAPRAVLAFSSAPAANPKSPAVLADTTFTATASGGASPVVISWNFGDGTPAVTGASVTHFFAVAGTYSVVATATDAASAAVTSTLSVIVTDAIKSPKLYIGLNFARTNADWITFTGTLRLPPGAKLGAQPFVVNIGGVTSTLTLNEHGSAASGGNSVRVFVKSRPDKSDGLNSKFYVRLGGSFQSALADETLTDRSADREPVKIKTSVTFLGLTYSATITQEYDAVKGVRGVTR